jgi:hypothetical protein
MNMLRRIPQISRLLVVPALLAALAGCDTDEHRIPPDQRATPVQPILVVVDLSSDKATLNSLAENPRAKLHVVAYRADTWEPLPTGTDLVLSTNLGNFESLSGPQELELDLIDGQADTFFYPGGEIGIARIRATVLGVFDEEVIEIK